MTANPHLPTTLSGKRKVVNASLLPAISSPTQLADFVTNPALRLPKWRAALARVNAGQGNALALFIGDSQTEGIYTSAPYSAAYTTDNYKNCFMAQVANAFSAYGMNAHFNGTVGNGTGVKYTGDGRISLTGWTAPSANTVGGKFYFANSTATLSFTPTKNVDKIEIFYGVASGLGTFSYDIDEGTPTNVVTNNTAALGKTTITCPTTGIHTVNIKWVSGNCYFTGFNAYDSSKSWVQFVNAGWVSATADSTGVGGVATPSEPLNAAIAMAPDLVVLEVGQNNIVSGTAVNTKRDLQAIITALKNAGADVVLVNQIPVPTSGPAGGFILPDVQAQISAINKQLAISNNIPLADVTDRWVSYAFSSALSPNYYGTTTSTGPLHPSGPGSSDYGAVIYEIIKPGAVSASPSGLIDANGPLNTLKGTTAGSVVYSQPIVGVAHKKFIAQAVGYENNTAVNQTITYPTAFTYTPAVTINNTSLTVSTTTTVLTITAPNNTTLFSGTVVVEGI